MAAAASAVPAATAEYFARIVSPAYRFRLAVRSRKRRTARASCVGTDTPPILRCAMTDSSARQFVVAYAILMALIDLPVLLPGNPYTSVRGFVVSVGVQALVAWRLWHGSSLAWLIAMLFAVGTVVSLVLMQLPPEASVTS